MSGMLIVLEGIDGSGTTTQAALLGERLRARGYDCVLTREPTAGAVGRLIRQALSGTLQDAEGRPSSTPNQATMALLFAADRVDHNQRVIEPALAAGKIVVSDRYVLSSLLYQTLAAEPDTNADELLNWLRALNSRARRADLTLVLDVSAEEAARRRASRGGPAELYETSELQRRLAQGYADAERVLPGEHLLHVDAEADVANVADAIEGPVMALLSKTSTLGASTD